MSAKTKAPKAPASDWIPVGDSLPDDELEVLIHAPDCDPDVCVGYHDGDHWRNVHAERVGVTHWMALPLPPKA